jgi:hypothetical protein
MKPIATLILGLTLMLGTIALTGCASKPTAKNAGKSEASVASNTTNANANANASDGSSILKNSTPVKVDAAVLQKSTQQGAKVDSKLSSLDATLNSIDNFTVTDDSGIK